MEKEFKIPFSGKTLFFHGDFPQQNIFVYKVYDRNGHWYIGHTTEGFSRFDEHIAGKSKLFYVPILDAYLIKVCNSEEEAKYFEKNEIHDASRRIYNNLTGLNTDYKNYSRFASIIRPHLLNKNLY